MVKNEVLNVDNICSYLRSIKVLSDIDTSRVLDLFSKAMFICPDEVKRVFVSNYRESDGKDEFKDIWFFSDSYVIETLNFIAEENNKIEITSIKNNISAVTIESANFDFSKKAENDSKLHLILFTLGNFNCDQIAYGLNCDVLMSIYSNFIKNNIVSGNRPTLF